MLETAGRTVMISGAARGLGRAFAQRLVDDGWNISCGARNPDAATAALDGPDERMLFHHYDAEDAASNDAWVAATADRFGGIDGVVLNAGILDTASFDELTEAALDAMWRINVMGPFRLIKATLPHLRASGHGRVVNLSSLSGLRVKGSFAPGYAISKHAVTALSEAVKNAGWDDGVRVTSLHPGLVNTDMVADIDYDAESMVQADDLAEVVATVMRLPNTAQVARLTVACELEPGF